MKSAMLGDGTLSDHRIDVGFDEFQFFKFDGIFKK